MNKQELLEKLRALDLPPDEYWIVAGGAMVLHGIREETHDIDLGCTKELADRLEAEGFPTERVADGGRRIVIGDEIEIYDDWEFDHVEIIDGVPVLSIDDLIAMKQALGREKDQRDLELIRAFLKRGGAREPC